MFGPMPSSPTRCTAAILCFFLAVPDKVAAWPSSYSCDHSCLASQTPGAAFGRMGIASYGAITGANCVITTNIPVQGFVPGQSYVVTVTSTSALARKVTCDRAGFAGQNVVNSAGKVTSSTHTWTATAEATASFRALCGRGGGCPANCQMWVAAAVSFDRAQTTSGTTMRSTTTTTARQTSTASANIATESVLVPSLQLLPGLMLGTAIVQNDLDVVVSGEGSMWIALGFSSGDSVSMTGDGKGVDLFACTNGAVKRYWMTTKLEPTGGIAVPGSSCSYVSGKTRMTFRRQLAATRRLGSVAVTPGNGQVVIYAHGKSGATGFTYHAGDKGGQVIDFQTMKTSEAAKKMGEVALFWHLICMVLSWGALLPWGVALANRTRSIPGAPQGAWFRMHKRCAVAGWLVQLVGFGMAVWHCADNVGSHFNNAHAFFGLIVVALGTLQPLNAVLRPPPPTEADKAKSTARRLFEIVHKGSGYTAVILGLLNVFAGVYLLSDQNYNSATIAIALSLALLGAVPVMGYTIFSIVIPNNAFSRMCVGGYVGVSAKDVPGSTVGAKITENPESQ